MTTYTHDEEGLIFLRSLNPATNVIHYRALPLAEVLPAIRHAAGAQTWGAVYYHLVRTAHRVRDDGEVFHKYAPLPVIMDADKSTLQWYMHAAREEIEAALAASQPKKSFLGRLFN
jgi:hypothetical protein